MSSSLGLLSVHCVIYLFVLKAIFHFGFASRLLIQPDPGHCFSSIF